MISLLPALVTAGAGLVLLVVVLLVVLRRARRFSRASTALRLGVAARVASLPALVNPRGRRYE